MGWSSVRAAVVGLCGVVLLAGVLVVGRTSTAAASSLVQVGAIPGWVGSSRPLGAVPPRETMAATVYLAQPHAAEAEAYAKAVSDPQSPLYHRFLSPAEYQSRFGPSSSEVSTVRAFLEQEGLRVGRVPSDDLYVRAEGATSRLDRVFHTSLLSYRHSGATVVAPAQPLSVPAPIAAMVSGVSGLDTSATVLPSGLSLSAPPVTCSSYSGQHSATLPKAYGTTVFPTAGCGYTPQQLHSAYGTAGLLASGTDGSGVNVAVLLFYPIPNAESDIDQFSANHGLPPLGPGQLTESLPAQFNDLPSLLCSQSSDAEEATGDLELVHDMAPAAHLVYVAAASCSPDDIVAAMNRIVEQHLADIVTNSYDLSFLEVSPATAAASHALFVQAAAEGIGFFNSSGDNGDNSILVLPGQTYWPASDPFVTAVGGTSLFIGADGQWEGEVGWGKNLAPVLAVGGLSTYLLPPPGLFESGSGGGRSQFPTAAYQAGVVPAALAGSPPRRVVPDVAAVADAATPVLVGLTVNGTYEEAGGSGTSVATPVFAGLEALAEQAAGGSLGFVNPLLYKLRDAGIFHDISSTAPLGVAYSSDGLTYLDTLQNDTSLKATPGYDDQTGLGSPIGNAYVATVSAAARSG